MDGCLASLYTCWTRTIWCIGLLCLRAGCNRLLMRPPKGGPTPRARPRVELIEKGEAMSQNVVHAHNTTATVSALSEGEFQWNVWTYSKTLGDSTRTSFVRVYTHKTRTCVIKQQPLNTNTQRELHCLRKCQHPNIVHYFAHRVRDGWMELAMEHSAGQDLFDYIIDSSPVNLEVVRQNACKLLTAVAYLHDELSIVHRDIKPENIIYDKDTGSLQLIDFGFARAFTSHTKLRSQVGTPFYTPPEIVYGRSYTCTVDEWSTGVTLFILLYGKPPFYGDTDPEIYQRIRNNDPWSVPDVRSSEAYDCIHHRLLCKNPAKRATAAHVLESAWLRPCRDTAQA